MTTGATGQLGLALPVQGELSGTWGDTVNNGITEYTNIAIAGTLTLTNDGAVTLANTTGDASASNITSSLTGAGTVTAQFAIVKVTGTLTAAKVITGPSYSKTYVVDNTTATYAVTFKASGQTGVSIVAGEKATVYYNGTDYVKVASSTADGVTTFSAGTTGFTPSTATSGAVTLAGTLATTNGGTGLTSFTSGGVLYASSTSALATGSALTFDGSSFNVVVGGSASSASGGTVARFVNSSASRIDVVGGNTGYSIIEFSRANLTAAGQVTYNHSTNAMSFSTNGAVTQATLDSSGNLGLGVTPSAWGSGSSAFQNSAGGIWRFGTDNIYFGQNYYFNGTNRIYSTTNNATEYQQGNGQHRWYNAPSGTAGDAITFTQAMTLDASGNLGVGTTSISGGATVNLQVKNASSASLRVTGGSGTGFDVLQASDSVTYLWNRDNAAISFGTNGTERARIDSVGYLSGVWADKVTALGNSGTATTITCTSGNVFTATLTGNCTFTLSAPSTTTANTATSFTLILTNDGTAGRTVAFSGGTFKYPGGSVTRTTTANAVDIWFFFSPNGGTTWYVSIPMANLS